MRRTNGGCGYAIPFSTIPERGQVSENSAHSVSKQRCDVFHDDEGGSYFANESRIFCPEAAPRPFNSSATTSDADVLTGETATDNVNGNSVCSESLGGEFPDIFIARHLGPVFRQHPPAEWVDLAEGNGLETARTLQAKVEPANSCEQGKGAEFGHAA
jgi:hypothetical protein